MTSLLSDIQNCFIKNQFQKEQIIHSAVISLKCHLMMLLTISYHKAKADF